MKRPATLLVRSGAARSQHREHSEGVFLTSSFVFDDAEQAAEKFSQPVAEYVYSRFSNPNLKTLNARIAALEEAPAVISTASGMAAILSTVMGLCKSGDSILCGGNVFGPTIVLLSKFIGKFGVDVDFVVGGTDAWRQAMRANTKLLIVETPSNPMLEVTDLAALADIAHQGGAWLAVDNCFCPSGQRPLHWGADLVMHSATKYLDGQGRVLGGAVAGSEELVNGQIYPFFAQRWPGLVAVFGVGGRSRHGDAVFAHARTLPVGVRFSAVVAGATANNKSFIYRAGVTPGTRTGYASAKWTRRRNYHFAVARRSPRGVAVY